MSVASEIYAEQANNVKNKWVCKLDVATDIAQKATDLSDELRFDLIKNIIEEIKNYEFSE